MTSLNLQQKCDLSWQRYLLKRRLLLCSTPSSIPRWLAVRYQPQGLKSKRFVKTFHNMLWTCKIPIPGMRLSWTVDTRRSSPG